jgi:hypothetical protein
MKKHEIHAAIIRMQSEQMELCPEIPIEYYSIYRQHKPREPAQAGTIQNKPERTKPKRRKKNKLIRILSRLLK